MVFNKDILKKHDDKWKYARKEIIRGLYKLPYRYQIQFKRMYSHNDLKRSSIFIVNNMRVDQLYMALNQVRNTCSEGVDVDEIKTAWNYLVGE